MDSSDTDTRAVAISIQNRLADPSNLGLSQSPAFYFEQRLRRKERSILVPLPIANAEKEEVFSEEDALERRVHEIAEVRERKRQLRAALREFVSEGWRQSALKREAEQTLTGEENRAAAERYERLLTVKQEIAKTEEMINQVEELLRNEETASIEKARLLHLKETTLAEVMADAAHAEAVHSRLTRSLLRLQEKVKDLWDIDEAYRETAVELHQKSLDGHNLVKELNNELQELKGNIRVFCRVRPLLPDDYSTMANFQISGSKIRILTSKGQHTFQFDRVFDSSCSQERVFEDISQLVRSALDGYKVSIFAYGQTGSGKTYTMEGPSDSKDPQTKGVIQRSVEQIFEVSQELKRFGWTFQLLASFVEVYNEQIRDLLEGSKVMTAFSANLLEPTVVDVREPSVLYDLLARAKQQRAVAQTVYNNHSSRSHSLFQLKITGENIVTQRATGGVLNLIDLAGSEKWDDKQEDESRRSETIAINKSLTCLGDVIHAMARKSPHIPFRNSKLTTILQNCLGADSKTLMFLNISPAESRSAETFNSLKFGSKVTKCNLKQQRAVIGRKE